MGLLLAGAIALVVLRTGPAKSPVVATADGLWHFDGSKSMDEVHAEALNPKLMLIAELDDLQALQWTRHALPFMVFRFNPASACAVGSA